MKKKSTEYENIINVASEEDAQNDNESNQRLLRLPQVLERVPVSKSTWWLGVKTGRFPKPIKLGDRLTCWKLSEIDELVEKGKFGSA